MNGAYSGRRARLYNRVWRRFEERTLANALAMIDTVALCASRNTRDAPDDLPRPLRVLDVACGTGLLLRRLLTDGLPECARDVEACGTDESADMLAQARAILGAWSNVRLEQLSLDSGPTAGLPYELGTFDLITCTNTLHYLPDPVAALTSLGQLLAPGGQLIIEDFARREPPFPWPVFEWVVRRLDDGHVRAYTLHETLLLCEQADLHVIKKAAFRIDWLWRGWALRGARKGEP